MKPHMRLARAPLPDGPAAAPRQPPESGLTVEIRGEHALSPEDSAVVSRLIRERPHVGIFVSGPWLSGYFEEPPAGVEPCLALVREGSDLRGVVPLGLARRRRTLHVRLLGGAAGSDRVDLLAVRGYEPQCADALLWWLGESAGAGGFVLELRDAPHDSALWGAVTRSAAAKSIVPREVNAVPYLDLSAYRAEALARSAPVTALARTHERHRRWLEGRGHVRVELARDAQEALAAFDTLVRLLHERWQAGGSSALDADARRRFHRRVIPRLLEHGSLRMVRVSVDLRTVAVYYGLAAGNWWGYYLAGYDRAWARRIHLGRLTLGFAIDLALQSGASEFDFLKGSEPVKYLWPVSERVTIDADVFAASRGAQLARFRRAAREAGAALANAVRPRTPGR